MHAPRPRADDQLGEPHAGLQKRNNLGQRIDQGRTLANEIRTFYCSEFIQPFELTEPDLARTLFETNTLGTMAMTQAVLPQFRAQGAGTIVNITSSVTFKALPLVSMYTASKAAVNAFTASLAIELAPFGINVRIVLPDRSLKTRFSANAKRAGLDNADYADMIQQTVTQMTDESGPVTNAADVAEAVWRAATDPTAPIRIPAGADAIEWAQEAGLWA
nr:SDR family NAD(P)-dependent oxidoreductase [Salinisphaera shabanensis]